MALERGNGRPVEEVTCVEGAVAQKFIDAAVQLVRAGTRDNAYLSTGPLPILRSVGIGNHVKLAHCIHAQQLSARAAWSQVDHRSARVFNAVEEKNRFLRAPSGSGEHVA